MMEPVVLPRPEKRWFRKDRGPLTDTKQAPTQYNKLALSGPVETEQTNIDRFRRYEEIKRTEQRCEELYTEDADIIIVAYGASCVCRNAVVAARAQGIKAGMIRPVTLWPFPQMLLRTGWRVQKPS